MNDVAPDRDDAIERDAALDTGSAPDTPDADAPDAPDAPETSPDGCATYCRLIAETCEGTSSFGAAQYTSTASCEAYCARLEAAERPDAAAGAGPIACRLAILRDFPSARPMTDCRAAGPGGDLGAASNCGGPCASFCAVALAACPGTFADATACDAACAGFANTPVYNVSVTSGDSRACRLYYLTQAVLQPAVHCASIAANSPACR